MSYHKLENEDDTRYYNIMEELITMLIISEGLYAISPSDQDSNWIKDHADEIDKEEFDEVSSYPCGYLRLGSHPPHAPG